MRWFAVVKYISHNYARSLAVSYNIGSSLPSAPSAGCRNVKVRNRKSLWHSHQHHLQKVRCHLLRLRKCWFKIKNQGRRQEDDLRRKEEAAQVVWRNVVERKLTRRGTSTRGLRSMTTWGRGTSMRGRRSPTTRRGKPFPADDSNVRDALNHAIECFSTCCCHRNALLALQHKRQLYNCPCPGKGRYIAGI